MFLRWAYRLALPLVLVALTACAQHTRTPRARPSAPPIPTAAARATTIHETRSISGIIAPFQNVALSNTLSEPAIAVNVNEGDHVTRGETLAVLDTSDLRANLAQAQAGVATDMQAAASANAKLAQARYQAHLNIAQSGDQVGTARAALDQAQHALLQAQTDLQRDRQLLAQGYIAQQAVDQQQTLVANDAAAVRSAQAALQSALTNQQVNGTSASGLQASNIQAAEDDARTAQATVGQAIAQMKQYQAQIDKATIVSPINGIVINRNLNPGEYPGSRTIFTLQQIDVVYAELNASGADTFAIPVGATANVRIPSDAAHVYRGRVVAVLGQVNPGSTNFTVKVLLSNPDARLQSGLPVTAAIALPPVKGIGIPTTAFLDDSHTSVMIADDEIDDTVAKTVSVRELASDGKTSIVTGLKAGEHVISNGQLGLTAGQSLDE